MGSQFKSRPSRRSPFTSDIDERAEQTVRRVTSAHVNFSNPSTRPSTSNRLSRLTTSTLPDSGLHRAPSRAQRADPSYASHRSKSGMTGMLDIDRPHARRDRTFVGTECAACEELLEHTLRGEKVLQLACGHVSHEACFYEYIRELDSLFCPVCEAPLGLDTSRGGNVLDLEKLSSVYRSQSLQDDYRSHRTAPSQATTQYTAPRTQRSNDYQASLSDRRRRHTKISSRSSKGHGRTTSNGTRSTVGPESAVDHSLFSGRRDPDHSVPTTSPRLQAISNPIPPPSITIRSEYPTLHRSKQQQSLTCLITVEMPDGKWKPSVEDLKRVAEQTRIQEEREVPRRLQTRHPEPRMSQLSVAPDELSPEALQELDLLTENLISRVDNWHGLDYSRFGQLRLHDVLLVGKDRQAWQELECYLFGEMLICVKDKKVPQSQNWAAQEQRKCTLKGSIMIKKHLVDIEQTLGKRQYPSQARPSTTDSSGDDEEDNVLTLRLSVPELPAFHLRFPSLMQLDRWREALFALGGPDDAGRDDYSDDGTILSTEYDDNGPRIGAISSIHSSYGANKSYNTAPTEYSEPTVQAHRKQNLSYSLHVPIDIVVVIPISSSMHAVKIPLLKDMLKFLLYSLGERDRLGLVIFGAGGGAVPLANLTSKDWSAWDNMVDSIKASGPKNTRIDPVEGANVAMDILMQRKFSNPISSILIVSDSSTAEDDSVDFVVSRAEAARVSIYTFGLGLTHKPDALIALSQRTKAAYLYVKDWMMIRDCVAGVLGSLQSVCHQNVVLKLRLPDGSPAKFVKVSGALMSSTRATGREAEASLGDLRFGEKRDVLVQLAVAAESSSDLAGPQDAWETIVSDLEALGGSMDGDVDSRHDSIEEVPVLQAHISYGDILREGATTQTPRPSLLTITVLPPHPSRTSKNLNARPSSPPIPPHPSVVQRRMELLTSDMMARALNLVSRGQSDRAQHLLQETRSILKGLGKGGLPPLPPPPASMSGSNRQAEGKQAHPLLSVANASQNSSPSNSTSDLHNGHGQGAHAASSPPQTISSQLPSRPTTPQTPLLPAPGIEFATMVALDAELGSALEWLAHPAVFARDARKAALQAIGVANSQRAYTFRSGLEGIWARRVLGVRAMCESSAVWGEGLEHGASIEE